jgi:hypothetical protein
MKNKNGFSTVAAVLVVAVVAVLGALAYFVWPGLGQPGATQAPSAPPTTGGPTAPAAPRLETIAKATSDTTGTIVSLPLSQAVSVPGTALRLTALDIIDSRCLPGPQCTNPGEVAFKCSAQNVSTGAKENFILSTVTTKSATVMGYKLQLVDVDLRNQIIRLKVL